MILTNCAVCATELGLTSGKKCGRCSTRYCGPECQVQHWERGGHDALCKKIKKGGGAEQFHADKKYKEAVAVAAEACAEGTKGQTCYICTQALHWKTKEGLVRMCACRGTAGFAHVSCLAEQAKILREEVEANNLGEKAWRESWARWNTCGLCKQKYHGVVACALSWACWKTYVGRPENRLSAMTELGNGLGSADRNEERLKVLEAELATEERLAGREEDRLVIKSNMATCYTALGRHEAALDLRREVYDRNKTLEGWTANSLIDAGNLALSLINCKHYAEAKRFLRDALPTATRILKPVDPTMLDLRFNLALALVNEKPVRVAALVEAEAILDDVVRTARRVFGDDHPDAVDFKRVLLEVQEKLACARVIGLSI